MLYVETTDHLVQKIFKKRQNSLESDFVDLEFGFEDARGHHTTPEDVLPFMHSLII